MAEDLQERVAALKHDLAKHVAWRSANLDERYWEGPVGEELMDALCADLLRTRQADGVEQTAWEVWARLTEGLPRPFSAAEFEEVEAAVETLRAAEPILRARDRGGLASRRAEIRRCQGTIRTELANLHRRLTRGAG